MKIYKYESYNEYVKAQTEANVKKIKNVWVKQETIEKIHTIQPNATHILCHGTRNGAEQKYFKNFYPNAEIIGTEISHTATDFEMTIQHDFHNSKEEWIDKFDILYSNSFDHSYDPEKSLSTWRDQIRHTGKLYLEIMLDIDNVSQKSDPLEINENELQELIASLDMKIQKILQTRGVNPTKLYVLSK